jgi:hypothetical protein
MTSDMARVRPSVSALFSTSEHATSLDGAQLRGRAFDLERRAVELGIWLDEEGRVVRAAWRATTCVALMACAERTCQLLEEGRAPSALDAIAIARYIDDLHPAQLDRAHLVARALRTALELDRYDHPGARP